MTTEEVVEGLKRGKKLHVDRRDAPLLPWLLSHPQIGNELVEVDEQYSYIKFWWNG